MQVSKVTAIVVSMTKGDLPFVKQAVTSVLQQSVRCVVRVYANINDTEIETVLGDQILKQIILRKVSLAPPGFIRNLASNEVDTEWIAFLDADDYWKIDKIKTQLTFADMYGLGFVASRHILIREDGTPFFIGLATHIQMPSSWLILTDFMKQNPFTDMPVGSDGEFWQRVKLSSLSKGCIFRPLIYYRVRKSSVSTSTPSKKRKLLFAEISRGPAMRQLFLVASYALSWLRKPAFGITRSR